VRPDKFTRIGIEEPRRFCIAKVGEWFYSSRMSVAMQAASEVLGNAIFDGNTLKENMLRVGLNWCFGMWSPLKPNEPLPISSARPLIQPIAS
jgi:hypothetical protein